MQRNRPETRTGSSADALRTEQVRSTYAHLPLTLGVVVVNASLLAFVLAPVAGSAFVSAWLLAILTLSAARAALWIVHRRLDASDQCPPVWSRLATIGSLASGLLWGCIPWIFPSLDGAYLVFVALVISGMSAGAATVHAAHLPSTLAYVLPACLPAAAMFLMRDTRLDGVVGIMIVIFAVALCIASLEYRRWFNASTMARMALARQTAALAETNERLRAEIEGHHATAAKLHQAQRLEAVGRLTAGIAHDFNNLLTAIGGSAEVAMTMQPAGGPARRFLATIVTAVGRAATLTQRLLVFGRGQALQPRAVDVNEVVRGMHGLMTGTLGGLAGIALALDPQAAIAIVDKMQLEQAILNLVINARDAMPDGGVITIGTRHCEHAAEGRSGRFVHITVADTGHGMTTAEQEHAFDPFFTTKEVGKGSGLGLSQVYGLARQSGGSVRIESQRGRGTTVSIFLPGADAIEAEDEAPARRVRSLAPSSDRQVLLLDDDPDVRDTVTAILAAAGYRVTPHASGQAALADLAQANSVALIVVDYAMPGMRGDRFAAEARRLCPDVPVVFITGHADIHALAAEAWVLRKPFCAEDLIGMAGQALPRHAA